jgi:hypothetical protein
LKKPVLINILAAVCLLFVSLCAHAAEIVVDCSHAQGPFRNIAGGMNFWGQKEGQEQFIEAVGADLYRIKIRLHRVRKKNHGYTNFPWQGDDLTIKDMGALVQNLNLAKAKGCRIMVQIYGIPKWLSVSDDEAVVTNNLPNYAKYPPRDHNEWARLMSASIGEIKRLGLKGVDYYEIFGEPNAGSTWYTQMMPCKEEGGRIVFGCRPNELGHNAVQVMKEFFKVYKFSVAGVRRSDLNAKIGGMGVIPNPSGIWWTRFFAEYVKSHELPLDFYSWHWYGIDEALSSFLDKLGSQEVKVSFVRRRFEDKLKNQGFSELEINSMVVDLHGYLKELKALKQKAIQHPYSFVSLHLERILNQEGLESTKLFLTEWNVNHVADRRHDTHYGASFVTRGLIDITDSSTEAQNFYVLANRSLSDYDRGFGGFYGLFRSDRTSSPKASFNAFKLFSMLGNSVKRVKVDVSGNNIYAIATGNDKGISLLLAYYVMARNPNYDLAEDITVRIKNIPFSNYSYRVYLIDKNHSNSYFGSGPEVEIGERGSGKGALKKEIKLPIYGVMMIQVERLSTSVENE